MFSLSLKRFLSLFILTCLIATSDAMAASAKCSVCGMAVQTSAPTTFESVQDGKPIHFCSFVCAHSYHEKKTKAFLWARDFGTGDRTSTDLPKIDAKQAYYLVHSEEVEKFLKDEAMPPSIVAFKKRENAEAFLARMTEAALKDGILKNATGKKMDGEIIQGFENIEKKY